MATRNLGNGVLFFGRGVILPIIRLSYFTRQQYCRLRRPNLYNRHNTFVMSVDDVAKYLVQVYSIIIIFNFIRRRSIQQQKRIHEKEGE